MRWDSRVTLGPQFPLDGGVLGARTPQNKPICFDRDRDERRDHQSSVLAAFHASATRADVDGSLYTYPGARHLFTDDELPDYDRVAADEAWRRAGALLAALD